ncbi:hypothetical protein CRM22_008213 [Opisthorchis felineus]|uniref:Uncharacterized protein n=1 Tax=Opisthorchis felineus TaxID=147828 RepID=A0A4S2LKI3_OPIFE|nr:hypothetical protein CRM22_008213 [Opisthorchis felineus]
MFSLSSGITKVSSLFLSNVTVYPVRIRLRLAAVSVLHSVLLHSLHYKRPAFVNLFDPSASSTLDLILLSVCPPYHSLLFFTSAYPLPPSLLRWLSFLFSIIGPRLPAYFLHGMVPCRFDEYLSSESSCLLSCKNERDGLLVFLESAIR